MALRGFIASMVAPKPPAGKLPFVFPGKVGKIGKRMRPRLIAGVRLGDGSGELSLNRRNVCLVFGFVCFRLKDCVLVRIVIRDGSLS